MIALYCFSFLIVLVACQNTVDDYDYPLPPPYCKNGKFDEDYIDDFILAKVNDQRAALLRGFQWNGLSKKKTPKGKTMTALTWGCGMEKKARETLNPNCTDEVMPEIPANRTGFFFKFDHEWAEPTLYSAIHNWTSEIDQNEVKYDSHNIRYTSENKSKLRNYLNLMSRLITKIGCSDVVCMQGKVRKYRALCLTNKPELKDNQVVMQLGKGGCLHGDECLSGYTCNRIGLCSTKA